MEYPSDINLDHSGSLSRDHGEQKSHPNIGSIRLKVARASSLYNHERRIVARILLAITACAAKMDISKRNRKIVKLVQKRGPSIQGENDLIYIARG